MKNKKVVVARPYDTTWAVDVSIASTPTRDVVIVDGLTGLIAEKTKRALQGQDYLGCKWIDNDNNNIRLYAYFAR